jgi:hypothetical protein
MPHHFGVSVKLNIFIEISGSEMPSSTDTQKYRKCDNIIVQQNTALCSSALFLANV